MPRTTTCYGTPFSVLPRNCANGHSPWRPYKGGRAHPPFQDLGRTHPTIHNKSTGSKSGEALTTGPGLGLPTDETLVNREMSPMERDIGTLLYLAQMPFLDRLELAYVSGTADRTVHDAVMRLERKGLVKSIRHATDLIASTRRLYVTSDGLRRLAERDGTGMQELLQRYPVSGHWRRILLERLDAVGVIYRVASSVAAVGSSLRFRWYRRAPLDAAMVLPDGRTVDVVRQGASSDRTGFSKRIWRLLDEPLHDLLLMLTPDDVRMRHASTILTRSRELVLLALEKNAALTTTVEQPVWHLASLNTVVDLRRAMPRVKPDGELPKEPPLSRPLSPNDLPVLDGGFDVPDHLLPAVLKPAEKRTLDILADWPWIIFSNLVGLLGVSPARTSQLTTPLVGAKLTCRVDVGGKERLALTDWGLALLAHRDRTSVGRLRNQWSADLKDDHAPRMWRNVSGTRSRLLARNMEHTEAVHWFLAQLVRQAKPSGYQVLQLDPPHKANRFFQHAYKLHPPRRLRYLAQGTGNLALLPGVGAPSGSAQDHGCTPCSLPALLLLNAAHG